MSWKSRLTYKTKVFVESKVGDNTFKFYPNRLGLLEELGEMSKPIARAMSVLFGTQRSDTTSVQESFREKPRKEKSGVETAESVVDKITVEAVSPQIADHRRKEREDAIDALINGLTNKRSLLMLGALLMDSLRDEFPYDRERDTQDVELFLYGNGDDYHGLDAPMLSQMVQGWLKANAKVFGDTGEQVVGLFKGKLEALRNLSPLAEMTSTTDGSSSKTPSSEPSDTDSQSPKSSD